MLVGKILKITEAYRRFRLRQMLKQRHAARKVSSLSKSSYRF